MPRSSLRSRFLALGPSPFVSPYEKADTANLAELAFEHHVTAQLLLDSAGTLSAANAHARSGDRVAIASYLGGGDHFDRAMVEFADRYADQNEADYAALRAAVDSGRIRAELEAA